MSLELKPAYQLDEEIEEIEEIEVLNEPIQPAYKLNDKVTYNGLSGIITEIYTHPEKRFRSSILIRHYDQLAWK